MLYALCERIQIKNVLLHFANMQTYTHSSYKCWYWKTAWKLARGERDK